MPILGFTTFSNIMSNLSPWRPLATSTSPIQAAKAASQTPSKINKESTLLKHGLVTPVTNEKPISKKRNHDSISSETLQGDDYSPAASTFTPPSDVPRKRLRRAPEELPVLQSVETDFIEQQRLPASGATKPANFETEEVTPSKWKQERQARINRAQGQLEKGWSEADVALFQKILLRGYGHALPLHWQRDFDVLPLSLFTDKEENTHIKSLNMNDRQAGDFRASRSLWSLINLGVEVQDDLMLDIDPHKRIARTFRHVLEWALDDADLRRKRGVLPLAVVCSAPGTIAPDTIQVELNNKLSALTEEWRRALKDGHETEIPPLYGIVVNDSTWAIVSYQPDGKSDSLAEVHNPDNYSTLMSTFNLSAPGQEVWNAIAFAIFAIHCRDELAKVLDRDIVMDYDGTTLPSAPDPDL